jgi:protein gp37
VGDTTIGWTDKTWNPVVGCERVSPGCKNCYALTDHDRHHAIHQAHNGRWSDKPDAKPMPVQYAVPFEWRPDGPDSFVRVQLFPERLTQPDSWKAPVMVFVNSVSDLFHESVPREYIQRVYDVMGRNRRHVFQVLTKRPERMEYVLAELGDVPPNVWHGASLEGTFYADRLDHLRRIGARYGVTTFVSAEPMVLPYDPELLNFSGIDWVIAGWESGRHARPWERVKLDRTLDAAGRALAFESAHVRLVEQTRIIRDAAKAAGAAFFLKQYALWTGKKIPEPMLDGRQWLEWPDFERCGTCKGVWTPEHADIHRCPGIEARDGGRVPAEPCGATVCCSCADAQIADIFSLELCPAHARRFHELEAPPVKRGLW